MPAKPGPSLQSVARLAGVSPSTVSRALRGHPLLNADTITRIRALAARVGYQANPLISDVMRRVRQRGRLRNLGTIAYLTFHDTADAWRQNATYRDFHAGAVRRAADMGFGLELIWALEPHLTPRRLTGILRSRATAGVIVGPRPTPHTAALLDWSHFSSAVVGVPLQDNTHHRAGSFHVKNMELLLEALAARGYRRPGLALLAVQAGSTDRGWQAAWHDQQQRLRPAQRVPILILPSLTERSFAAWWRRHRPDVVIGLQDEFVPWLTRLGQRVPDAVAFARLSRPAPDTAAAPAGIHQFPDAIGAAAVDLVINQIFSGERGLPATPRALLIEGRWCDGWTARTETPPPYGVAHAFSPATPLHSHLRRR